MRAIDGRSAVAKAIKANLYNELREALTKPNQSKKSWTQTYIEEMLKEAKKSPNSPIGQLVAKQIMSDGIIEKLDAETDKYLARDIDFNEFRLLKTLYDKQRDVFLDNDRKKIIIGSRRIGKTELAARLLLADALHPNRKAIFISLKFENAIRQCYSTTIDLAHSLNFPIARESKSDGEILLANGSTILFKGNSNKAEADKLLGYKFSCVVVDEIQNQCNASYLLDTVLTPALADYPDSRLVLLGTPPRIAKTKAEDIWKNYKGWKKYSWNMKENPYIHDVDKMIQSICDEKGVTEDAPFIQRELFGVFVYDTESMVYKDYKTYTQLPSNFIPTDIAIGCDYGFQDYNAIAALAYNRNTRQAYVVWQSKFNKSTVTEIVAKCSEAYEYCKKLAITNPSFDLSHIRFFCDTNEQSISFEMKTNYKLPVYNCYKHDKKMAISQLSDWLRTGTILVKPDTPLTDEFDRIVYKRDEDDTITAEIDDDLFHPDIADALLYASRQYAFDCGYEKKQVEKKQSDRAATLPKWIGDEYDNQ